MRRTRCGTIRGCQCRGERGDSALGLSAAKVPDTSLVSNERFMKKCHEDPERTTTLTWFRKLQLMIHNMGTCLSFCVVLMHEACL